MGVSRIVVHTDVILEHLCGGVVPSALREAHNKFFCYTTVFNAIELFSMARSGSETKAVEDAMAAMKVLGLNAKNARRFGELLSRGGEADRWNVLIGGLCVESRLPLLTDRQKDFQGIPRLRVVSTAAMRQLPTARRILKTAPKLRASA